MWYGGVHCGVLCSLYCALPFCVVKCFVALLCFLPFFAALGCAVVRDNNSSSNIPNNG